MTGYRGSLDTIAVQSVLRVPTERRSAPRVPGDWIYRGSCTDYRDAECPESTHWSSFCTERPRSLGIEARGETPEVQSGAERTGGSAAAHAGVLLGRSTRWWGPRPLKPTGRHGIFLNLTGETLNYLTSTGTKSPYFI